MKLSTHVRSHALMLTQSPTGYVKALAWWPLMRVTVCRARGHRQGQIARLIGCCDRCYDTLPLPRGFCATVGPHGSHYASDPGGTYWCVGRNADGMVGADW